ncbi:MAG: T9SS type A sorting domain-containing protein [Saprospiraceae bacterium]|nr:T9SS type A sorting domain-containing protein [Saprospiraceae bacterium]
MKNAVVFLLGLILWAPTATGQITLPRSATSSKLPSAFQRPHLFSRVFNEDAVNSPEFSQNINEEVQLDSIVTMLAHDGGGGNVIVTPFTKKSYYYPNSSIISETDLQRHDGKWMPVSRTQQRFDQQGRLFAVFAEVYDSELELWIPDSRIIIYFRGSSLTLADSVFVLGYSQESNTWIRLLTVHNTFNDLDVVSESFSTILFEDDLELTFKDVYHYDHIGNDTLIESFLIDGEDEIVTGREDRNFAWNFLISTTTSTADGLGGFIPESKITYTYSGQGAVDTISSFQYLPLDGTWSLIELFIYQLDTEHRTSSEEYINLSLGTVTEHRRITYDYLDGDNLAAETLYFIDLETGLPSIDQRSIYFYSSLSTAVPTPTRFETLDIFPNPTLDQVEFTIAKASLLKIYRMDGLLIGEYPVAEGRNQIDLVSLVPGVYTMLLENNLGTYTTRVVKL